MGRYQLGHYHCVTGHANVAYMCDSLIKHKWEDIVQEAHLILSPT